MPRTARLDAPGLLHHVMIRGIEGRKIFRNNNDRKDFIDRLETLYPEMQITCYIWLEAFLVSGLPENWESLIQCWQKDLV